MPHIIIEYSSNLDRVIGAVVDAVHDATVTEAIAAPAGVRTRAAARHHYRIADGDTAYGFLALIARFGPGREKSQLQRYLQRITDVVETELAPLADTHRIAISTELQFIDPDYRINRNQIAQQAGDR